MIDNKYTNPNQDYMEAKPHKYSSFLLWENEPLMDVLLWSFPGRYTPMTEEARLISEAEHKIVHIFENREAEVAREELPRAMAMPVL